MRRKFIRGAALLALVFAKPAFSDDNICKWCVADDKQAHESLRALAALEPRAQLGSLRSQGLCVEILDSGRVVPAGVFVWGSVEKPRQKLASISTIKNLFGKTLCRGERPIAEKCATILIASDAPKSTLLHEYLHWLQLKKDDSWCAISKELWVRPPTLPEADSMRDKEWDVHKLLWQEREKLSLNFEDKIAVAGETMEEAEARKLRDPSAPQFIASEGISRELDQLIRDYQKKLNKSKP